MLNCRVLSTEILTHILSHLPFDSLDQMSLTSQTLHELIRMPHAWQMAFKRFFPGVSILQTRDPSADACVFTCLKPRTSWRNEYMLRTRLLRCLARGRPAASAAFASTSTPGSPVISRGSAQITFHTRHPCSISHLSADFGSIGGNKPPRLIHGSQDTGLATYGDPRTGRIADWGAQDHMDQRNFRSLYPGEALYGINKEIIGVPNMMDLSNLYGSVYAQGFPGGKLWFRHLEERTGRALREPNAETICAVWIAKSSNVPNSTHGLIGILAGTSQGELTAYSVGTNGVRTARPERGEIVASWAICPGIPITNIEVDDSLDVGKLQKGQFWAVVVNALGQIFCLSDLPERQAARNWSSHLNTQDLQRQLLNVACETGRNATWHLVPSSQITSETSQWDMRRRLHIDFSGGSIIMIRCGLSSDNGPQIVRYTKYDDWRTSQFLLEKLNDAPITATAFDMSPSALINEENLPGHSSRFMAVGTKTGAIALFDVRSSVSSTSLISNFVHPVRLIFTKSPRITYLALTALQVVHGGSDGLVQVWDPLASTTYPIRTICSQCPNRRRGDPILREEAVGAICLDPEPSKLRGMAAIGNDVRYWSYSSAFAEQTPRDRQRSRRADRNSISHESQSPTPGRSALQDFIINEQQELERERRDEKKENRRRAQRFGLHIFGPETKDAEMIAYAKMLSTEDHSEDCAASDLARALHASLECSPQNDAKSMPIEDDDPDLDFALQLSRAEQLSKAEVDTSQQ